MALRLSDGLRNHLMDIGSFKQAFSGGKLRIFSGAQPANANAAETGTLLVEIVAADGAWTAEVPSAGSVTLATGASGSVDDVTIGDIDVLGTPVTFLTSLAITAGLVVDQINKNPRNYLVKATLSGAKVILTSKPGMGDVLDAAVVDAAVTTLTTTDVNMGTEVNGVNAANGLQFEADPTTGALEKDAGQVWSGTAVATGTAGWFRFVGALADAGAADSVAAYNRLDGNIATSGANLNLSATAIVTSALQTINTFTTTEPAN